MNPFNHFREIAATPAQLFAAIADPERLSRWWGPAGFTNTFESFDFSAGGRWLLTMHGPDGTDYPNEYRFAEIDAPRRVVIEHVSVSHHFLLTIGLAPSPAGTAVTWSQAFDDDATARGLEAIVVPANEQNLDRLAAEVLRLDSAHR